MKLIDADALKEYFPLPCEKWEMKGQQTLWDVREIREAIDLMPIVDAVEVVRCKDCKECEIDEVFHDYWCNGRKVWKDHYCACGERRTDE